MNNKLPEKLPLKNMFSSIPESYDMMNRLMTWRMDERWRKKAAAILLKERPARVMDICCGTGDLAVRLACTASPGSRIFGMDFSMEMLDEAVKKAGRRKCDIPFICADAATIPFTDNSMEGIGIAFAFRNLTWNNHLKDKFLNEVIRVLSPGSAFVIVESSQPSSSIFRWFFHIYCRLIIGLLGGLISGHRAAYSYLARSAEDYYSPDEVKNFLLKAGFSSVKYSRLLGGVAAIHVAVK